MCRSLSSNPHKETTDQPSEETEPISTMISVTEDDDTSVPDSEIEPFVGLDDPWTELAENFLGVSSDMELADDEDFNDGSDDTDCAEDEKSEVTNTKLVSIFSAADEVDWEEAEKAVGSVYTGYPKRSMRRVRQKGKQRASDMHGYRDLTSYFGVQKPKRDRRSARETAQLEKVKQLVIWRNDLKGRVHRWRLPPKLGERPKGGIKPRYFESYLQIQRTQALSEFYNLLLKEKTRMKASVQVSENKGRGKNYWLRFLRKWARNYEMHQILPTSGHLGYARARSILLEPDIQFAIQKYIRSCKWAMDPSKLQRFLKNEMSKEDAEAYAREISEAEMPIGVSTYLRELAPAFDKDIPVPSLRTLRGYMVILGFRWEHWRKTKYFDGHDREDVVRYRKRLSFRNWRIFDHSS